MLRYLLPLALLAAGAPVHASDRHDDAATARAADADCSCGRAHRPLSRSEMKRLLRERRAEGRSYYTSGYLAPGYAAYGAFEGYGGLAYSPYGPAYFGERGPNFRRRD